MNVIFYCKTRNSRMENATPYLSHLSETKNAQSPILASAQCAKTPNIGRGLGIGSLCTTSLPANLRTAWMACASDTTSECSRGCFKYFSRFEVGSWMTSDRATLSTTIIIERAREANSASALKSSSCCRLNVSWCESPFEELIFFFHFLPCDGNSEAFGCIWTMEEDPFCRVAP